MKYTDQDGVTYINDVKIHNKETLAALELADYDEHELFVFMDGDSAYAYSEDDFISNFSNMKALAHVHQRGQPILNSAEIEAIFDYFPYLKEALLDELDANRVLSAVTMETIEVLEKLADDLDYMNSEENKAIALSGFQVYLEQLNPEAKYALQESAIFKHIFKFHDLESLNDFLAKANSGNPFCLAGASGMLKTMSRALRTYQAILTLYPELENFEIDEESLSKAVGKTYAITGHEFTTPSSTSAFDGPGDISDEEEFEDIEALFADFNAGIKKDLQSLMDANDVSALNEHGQNTVHLCVLLGDSIELKAQLERGVDPNLLDASGETPLNLATKSKNHVVVKLLMTYGANLSGKRSIEPGVVAKKRTQKQLDAASLSPSDGKTIKLNRLKRSGKHDEEENIKNKLTSGGKYKPSG